MEMMRECASHLAYAKYVISLNHSKAYVLATVVFPLCV